MMRVIVGMKKEKFAIVDFLPLSQVLFFVGIRLQWLPLMLQTFVIWMLAGM